MIQLRRLAPWGWQGGGVSPSPARFWGGRGAAVRGGCKSSDGRRRALCSPLCFLCAGAVARRSSLDDLDAKSAGPPRRQTAVTPAGQTCNVRPASVSWGGDALAPPPGTHAPRGGCGRGPVSGARSPALGRHSLDRGTGAPSCGHSRAGPRRRAWWDQGCVLHARPRPLGQLHGGILGREPDKRCRMGTVQMPLADTCGLSHSAR